MNEASNARFVDIDHKTGSVIPTTYDSMRAAFSANYPISEHIPDAIRSELLSAGDSFALAFGQANIQHEQMYNPLTNNAFLHAMRAFEMALRDCLSGSGKMTLSKLIDTAMQRGLLRSDEDHQLLYRMLREDRNAITHGADNRYAGGSFLGPVIGLIIMIVNHLYDSRSPLESADGQQ